MAELNNDKLNKVAGGTGDENGGFQIGDWVYPKKQRLSPQGLPTYFRIDDILEPDSSMPRYIVYTYVKNPIDGSLTKRHELGEYLADELGHGNNPPYFN